MIIDLTFEIENNMPTCGTPWHQKVEIKHMGTIETVGRNTHRIVMGSHSGTHIDAPYHFIESGKTIESIEIDNVWGRVKVIDLRNKKRGDIVELSDLEGITVEKRMLFVFGWYHNWKKEDYYIDYPCFSTESINYLINGGLKMIAMDTPSPDPSGAIATQNESDSPNHKMLLNKGITIVEYLNNTDVLDCNKEYEIVALPLKIRGSDGSPARVLLKEVM